ncbi:MAG: RNA polymerase sigma factor [Terriglobales bacterium]
MSALSVVYEGEPGPVGCLARAVTPVAALAPAHAAKATVEDRQLVARCLAGDASAWEAILQAHSRQIYSLCYRFTGRAEDADDLSQEVCLRVYRNLGQFRAEQGSLKTWILSLTRNLLIDHYRRRKNDRLTDSLEAGVLMAGSGDARPLDPAEASHRAPDAGLLRREMREQIQAGLTRLSPELREAVILRDLEDLEYKEIAALLRIPEGTVKSRINRGRIELARLLRGRLGGAAGQAARL